MKKVQLFVLYMTQKYGFLLLLSGLFVINILVNGTSAGSILYFAFYLLILGAVLFFMHVFIRGNNHLLCEVLISGKISMIPYANKDNTNLLSYFIDDMTNISAKYPDKKVFTVATHGYIVLGLLFALRTMGFEYNREKDDKKTRVYKSITIKKDAKTWVVRFLKPRYKYLSLFVLDKSSTKTFRRYCRAVGEKRLFYDVEIPADLIKTLRTEKMS